MRGEIIQKEVIVFFLFGVVLKWVTPFIGSWILERIILHALPVYVIISVLLWARSVIQTISAYLGIHCFSFEKRPRKKLE